MDRSEMRLAVPFMSGTTPFVQHRDMLHRTAMFAGRVAGATQYPDPDPLQEEARP
jgi:hypothetical protein